MIESVTIRPILPDELDAVAYVRSIGFGGSEGGLEGRRSMDSQRRGLDRCCRLRPPVITIQGCDVGLPVGRLHILEARQGM